MRQGPAERKDLQKEMANEGFYLLVAEEGLELWEATGIDDDGQPTSRFTGLLCASVEAAHDYVFGSLRWGNPPLPNFA
jgi:hypothetical protein